MNSYVEELKPCPFCGSTNLTCENSYGASSISCNGCELIGYVLTGLEGVYLDDVIAKWNTRANECPHGCYKNYKEKDE